MRILLLVTACVLVSGCSFFRKSEAIPPVQPVEAVAADECYTVDLFTEVTIEQPEQDVPEAYQQFLGEWGGGAWNDVWCHGLLISKIYADGRVELVDMHAPYAPWNQPATAFRRVGRVDAEGNLRFAYGTARRSYRVENGKLVGTNNGQFGNLSVELARQDGFAITETNPVRLSIIPTPNPVRLSQLGLIAKAGG
jgi:hypothetical protein